MSKQDDELRGVYSDPPCTTDHTQKWLLITRMQSDGTTYDYCDQCKWVDIKSILADSFTKAEVLNLLKQYDTQVRGTTQNHLNPMHWTKRTKHRNELRDELIEALGLTSKEK